jgi:hypothetical protein
MSPEQLLFASMCIIAAMAIALLATIGEDDEDNTI